MANSSMLSLPSITAPSAHRLAGHRRFVGRLEAVEDVAAGLGVHALGGEQVLDAERNALERPALPLAEALVGAGSHRMGALGGHRDVGIERGLASLDRREIGLRSARRR